MSEERPVLVIDAARRGGDYWRDCWDARELLGLLAWRDLRVRYSETAVGVLWALARPLATVVVFSVVFGRLGRLPSGGVPYPLLVLAGVLPWQCIAAAVGEAGQSLLANTSLVTKVYFPRVLVPAAALASPAMDLLVGLGFLVVLLAWYQRMPGIAVLAVVPLVLATLLVALGAALWVAALSVRYRDLRFLTPYLIQFGQLVSPVGFASDVVPERWRMLYALNPAVGLIDGFRWAVAGAPPPAASAITVTVVAGVLLVVSALLYFRATERTLADAL